MRCKVLLPHCRYVSGQLVTYEPTGIVDAPNDDTTRDAIRAGRLEPLIEWRPHKDDAHSSCGWAVYEYPDTSATCHVRCVATRLTEEDARRIANAMNKIAFGKRDNEKDVTV